LRDRLGLFSGNGFGGVSGALDRNGLGRLRRGLAKALAMISFWMSSLDLPWVKCPSFLRHVEKEAVSGCHS